MKTNLDFRHLAALPLAAGVLVALAACGSGDAGSIGPAQADHGPMGTTATPSRADVPGSNSQSTPVMKPQ